MKSYYFGLIFILVFASCKQEHDCIDMQIGTAFIGFKASDLDTIVLRKYEAGSNFTNLIDTLILVSGNNTIHIVNNDTTRVLVSEVNNSSGVKFGNDWQIYVPAQNRTIHVSQIIREKKTIKCGGGMDKQGCACNNPILSFKQDTVIRSFSIDDVNNRNAFVRF